MIEIVDVGASDIDGEPEYAPLLHAGLARVTGFDVQMLRENSASRRYFPQLIADGKRATYHCYAAPGLNSLLELDSSIIDMHLPRAQLLSTHSVQTQRLDDVREIERCDLLKLDCQGSELSVLLGAHRLLRSCVLVQVEMSFFPLYRGQPTLGDVDHCLRQFDFLPRCVISHHSVPSGQWIDADFLYVKHEALCSDEQQSIKWEIIRRCYSSSSPRFSGFTVS